MIKFLVVDDDDALRSRLARAFEDRGFAVAQAANCSAAIAHVREHVFDRAVVDLRMEGPGGLAVVQELRTLQPAIQIVVVTGYGSIATAVEAIRLGARDYLTKPTHADQILAAFDADPEVPAPRARVPSAIAREGRTRASRAHAAGMQRQHFARRACARHAQAHAPIQAREVSGQALTFQQARA